MRSFFAAAIFASASALYDGLIKIDDSNYKDLILSDDQNLWIVTFYADWCPYASALETEMMVHSRAMQVAGYNVKYGAIDATKSPELVHRYEIKRSPTIEVFGVDKTAPYKYGGTRTAAALDAYVIEECTYFGYDVAIQDDGYIKKSDYDVEALEAEMNSY